MGAPSELLKNRKRAKKARTLLAISASLLVTFVVISYVGATVARYLANSTTVAFSNKSTGDANLMKVGFRVQEPIGESELETYHLTSDSNNYAGGGYVYWSDLSVGAKTMQYIVSHEGYSASNTVKPITSKRFQTGDEISLYDRPSSNSATYTRVVDFSSEANKSDYIAFDILFNVGVIRQDETVSGVANNAIYFDNDTAFAGKNNITQALRLGFESAYTSDIISPGRNEKGSIAVGGRMDLDEDGYFDFTSDPTLLEDGEIDETLYEIAYGDFVDDLTDDSWGLAENEDIPADTSEVAFYNGSTKSGVRPLTNAIPATAHYDKISTYQQSTGNMPIAVTDENGIAEVKIKIWLEGWDHACTNLLVSGTFGAQLKFISSPLTSN